MTTTARHLTRALTALLCFSLVAATASVVATRAEAAGVGTVLFDNAFNDRTVDGTGSVTVPTPASGSNVACLTATGNSATLPLLSCAGSTDVQGSGKLRLTNSSLNQVGGVFGLNSFPTSRGLDVSFTSFQWGGGSADGISFVLAAVDPANPVAPTTMGPSGGSLGYARAASVKGLTNAYLGVGLDVFGNFSSVSTSGTGCATNADFAVARPGTVAVRGPGTGTAGYCGLATTSDGTLATKLALRAGTRAASAVPVQVLINPTTSAFTSSTGASVAAGSYKVLLTPVGQTPRTLTGTLPAVPSTLYPSTSWLDAAGVPRQLAFGFVGSTGSVTDAHEISDVRALTFDPVPQLSVHTTSHAAAVSQPGAPVTYDVLPAVLPGADVGSAVSVTQTVPVGVVPVGAFGTGWTCQTPVGRTVTCTTTASSFTNGTSLPALTIVAIVTVSGLTATTVQASSPVNVSSVDAGPGTDTAATNGGQAATPSAITVTPSVGRVSGGGAVTIGGTSITAASAIEIGTSAEQAAGTPVVLLPCPGVAAAGCFTVTGSTLSVSSWPARASAATTSVTVVTSGVAAAADYVYADRPATSSAPTAIPGITSATVSWVAPGANGSALTGYTVTPTRNGVTQAPLAFDASATTRTLTGLTAAASYTFVVTATNSYGTSATSPASAAVVPYTLPGTPTVTAVSASTNGATLTFSAPTNGGSAITGYVVTPYVGLVAQVQQVLSGTATTRFVGALTPGTAYSFTVAAQNLAGTGPASARSSTVTPNVSPTLAFAAPPAGEVGIAYSRALTVSNGTGAFVWTVSAGALPDGLTLSATTGLVAGTPTAAGTFALTVRVTDSAGESATRAVSLVIAAAPALTFTPAAGEVGVALTRQPVLTGGTGPFAWAVTSGSLPSGVSLSATTGLLSGTPAAAGAFAFALHVTDSFGQVATRTVALSIVAQPAFAATAPPLGKVGVGYHHGFDVTGGALPLTWSVSAGSLPAGLALDPSTGAVAGTPTTTGSYPFTVSVVDANGQAALKAVTAVVAPGPLLIAMSASTSSAAAGETVAYTVTVTNTGIAAWAGVALTDPLTAVLDDATYNGNLTASSGTASYAAPTVTWTGDLAAGATMTLTYSVTVSSPALGNRVLASTVTSTTLGTNCAAASPDPACTATVTVPGLTIVTSADTATTTPGRTVHHTVQVTNSGQSSYAGATLTVDLTETLDDATYDADATATSGNVSFAGSGLTWTGGLAIGATATISYSVTVSDPDTGNRSIVAAVTSSSPGSPCPAATPAAQCSTTVTVLVPALTITQASGPSTTTPGAVVPLTTTLTNTGQTAYTGATAKIALAGAVDDATYGGDAAASAGTVSHDAGTATLTWTGDLAIGAVVTITASLVVHDPDTGNRSVTTVATSAAAGSSCPSPGSATGCTSTASVLLPSLTITTAAGGPTTTPGSVVTYTTTATNTGQTTQVGATLAQSLTGVLDDATYDQDASSSTGSVSYASPTLTWTGDLAVGASATVTWSVTVRSPDPGDLALVSSVLSTTRGSSCLPAGTDPRCGSSVTVLIPGLLITQTSDAATAVPGQVVHQTTTATNTGQTSYVAAAVVVAFGGVTDDATYNADVSTSTGTFDPDPDGTSATWTLSLAPGATATTTVGLTVNDPDTGDRSLQVSARSDAPGSSCPTGGTAPACRVSVTVLVPGLTISKTADSSTVSPGGTVGYTVVVTNDGETTYPAARFDDDLAQVLTDAIYDEDATATSGSLSRSSSVLSWTGSLAPGATATVSYSVTVRDPDPGDKRMVNTVRSSSKGSNCGTGSTDLRCRTVVDVLVPALSVVTSSTATTTVPGATVVHTMVVTDNGATSFAAASVTASLTGLLDDATYGADAVTTRGAVSVTGSDLTWTGSLAPGQSATITYSAVVHAADTGDDQLTSIVTSSTSGSSCPSDATDPRCRVSVPVARLVLSQAYEHPTTTPGEVVRLNGTFSNTGAVPYTGITVSSLSAGTTDDATPTGDQTATSGTLSLSATAISWTGSIPVGGTVSITGTLTVKDPAAGDRAITGTLASTAPGSTCPSGGTDPRCTALITVLVPQLTVTKAADRAAVVPGGTVAYTVTVTNTGQTAYTSAVVVDALAAVLDKSSYDGNASTSSGSVAFSGVTLTWTGDLAPGASAVVTYSVTVPGTPTGDKTLINTVSSTAVGSTCLPGSSAQACRSTVAILTPALTLVQHADLPNATLGSTVTYTVTATNTGQTGYAAATFSESLTGLLDDAAYGGDATATSGTVAVTGGTLSWTGALAPGTAATITFTVTIDNPALGDRTMTGTVTSATAGSTCAAGSPDTRCTTTVLVTDATSLTLTKTASAASTVASGTVHYTDTITNSTATDVVDADLTDPLAGILDDATYGGDVAADGGSVSLSGTDLTWTGTVPAGGTVTITYTVITHDAITGDQLLTGTLTSTSLPSSNSCSPGSTDPRCLSTVTISRLVVEQHYAQPTTTPGSTVLLSATFTNTGSTPYDGVTIASPAVDTLDDAVNNGDETASSGTLSVGASAVSWTGNIPVGGTVSISGTLTVRDPDPGNRVLTGTLATTIPGSNCPTGSLDLRCTAVVQVLLPQLTIHKTADRAFVVPGGTTTYTITVENTGETAYTGAQVQDTLVGVLDDATLVDAATATTGTVTQTGPALTWTGDLAVGATATVTYAVIARTTTTGDKTMVNPVSSTEVGSTCPPSSGSPACHSTVVVLTPALTVTSSADRATTVPGQTVTYTVVATNTGQTAYASAIVTVGLGDVLDDADYPGGVSATRGSAAVTGGTLTWTGTLTPTQSTTITYAVVVDDPVTGSFRLGQTAVSPNQGSTCPTGGDDPRCVTSVPIASLHVVNGADVTETLPTGVVLLTSTITNTGQVPYVGISVVEDFRDATDDFTYNGDGGASSGSLVFSSTVAVGTWTGDVPVGASVTITGSGTVDDPGTGNRDVSATASTDAPGSNCPAGSADAVCASHVPVRQPGLSIVTTADTATSAPGATVGYTLAVTNTGETAYTGATVTVALSGALDDGQLVGEPEASSGSVTVHDGDRTLTWTGDLAVGASATIAYDLRVDAPDAGDKLVRSTTSSGALGSSCPPGAPGAGCVSVVLVLVPLLDIAVATERSTTVPGAQVGYVVTVHNAGQTTYVGASVTTELVGVLDDATYDGGASATTGTVSVTAPQLTWSGDLAVGETAIVTYSVTVNDPDHGDRRLITTLTSPAPGSTCGTQPQCTSTVSVLVPGLHVSTHADRPTATPGDAVDLTIEIANTGETGYVGTTVTTSLTDVLDDAAFTGQLSASSGIATYAAPVVSWTGDVGVGATVIVTFRVTIGEVDAGDRTLSTTAVSSAPGSSCPPSSNDPTCTATVQVLVPVLTIVKTAGAPTTTPGSTVAHTITVTNTGETDYAAATVHDSLAGVLSDATYAGDATATSGVLDWSAPVLTWTGDLARGAVATITYSVTVDDPDLGDKLLVSSASSTTPGSTCPPGSSSPACSTYVVVLVPSLSLTTSADRTTVTTGGQVTWTTTLTNTGETAYAPAQFVTSLVDVLDDGDWVGDATATSGTVTLTDGAVTWSGPLAVGASATVTYSVSAAFPARGNRMLAGTVQSPSVGAGCPAGCTTSVAVLVPGLDIDKTADTAEVVAGGVVRYTITATNTGEADYDSADLTDDLSGVLDDAAYAGDARATTGSVTFADSALTWHGFLARDASVVVTYSVTVPVSGAGDGSLVNAVGSVSVGASCALSTADPACTTTTSIADRSITLSGLTPSFALGGSPGTTTSLDEAVAMTVTTNSSTGYDVTVQAAGDALEPLTPGNLSVIAMDHLLVRESGTTDYRPVSTQAPLVVHRQDHASAPSGDAVGNDFQVTIPFVDADTYATTLDYIATAQ